MRAPSFWWLGRPNTVARLLTPLGTLYGSITAARMGRAGYRSPKRVICVGNVTVGGAGKTPVAIAIASLIGRCARPVFLSRGYGGLETGPLVVDPAWHDASQVGDEPLLLARLAPTVIARDRQAGAQLCERLEADIIIMDDGLQNPAVWKDLSIAVIDAAVGIGNGLCLPAGALRAPIERQWPHIDAVLLLGEGDAGERAAIDAHAHGIPVHRAKLVLDAETVAGLRGRRLLAFAGIGRPEKFFGSLRDAGLDVGATVTFGDHQRLREAEARDLLDRASREGLALVTTEKDAVRLSGAAANSALAGLFRAARAVPVSVRFMDEAAFSRLLLSSAS